MKSKNNSNKKKTTELESIIVKGTREHNLKNSDVEFPKKGGGE